MDLRRAFARDNLAQAWRWTLANSEARYKNYFRHVYRAYSLSEIRNLDNLRDRLRSSTYQPTHATKIFFPKPSGVLRPYSLLVVEDQIVYQALVNIVADRLIRVVGHRYGRTVFGHMYGGRGSAFFYRDWRKGYRAFSGAVERAVADGYDTAASFDLTACYDSIDHSVLVHYLADLGLDHEFCQYLVRLLRHWTATSHEPAVYQGHGIPQGPQPSGLLAEVVLRHFDDSRRQNRDLRYFRYVDDIRLFGKSDRAVRARLVQLDVLSKDVGLFPQTSKIDIHKVVSVRDEIKSISNPPEPKRIVAVDQHRVRRRIAELTARYKVRDSTRFKFTLGAVSPHAATYLRCLRVVERQPELYESIFRYLARADALPASVSKQAVTVLKSYDLYANFTAKLIDALTGRIHPRYRRALLSYCRSRLTNATRDRDPELRAAATVALAYYDDISWNRLKYNATWKGSWWTRSVIANKIAGGRLADPRFHQLLKALARDDCADVALGAAEPMVHGGIKPEPPTSRCHRLAQHAFKEAGLIGRVRSGPCPVQVTISEQFGSELGKLNWKRYFGREYRGVVRTMSRWNGYRTSDPTAWVNITDTINDLIVRKAHQHDRSLKGFGTIGGALVATAPFARKYPVARYGMNVLHELRLESDLSHPFVRATGRRTRRIAFKEIAPLVRLLRRSYRAIETAFIPII